MQREDTVVADVEDDRRCDMMTFLGQIKQVYIEQSLKRCLTFEICLLRPSVRALAQDNTTGNAVRPKAAPEIAAAWFIRFTHETVCNRREYAFAALGNNDND